MPAVAAAGQPDRADLDDARGRLQRILLENIVPFWYPQTIDAENGGYHLNHDGRGKWLGPAGKALVTQARMVWFFSRLYNEGYGSGEHLAAARSGFEFMRDRMWDRVFGGFFWEMDTTGRIGTKPHKHLASIMTDMEYSRPYTVTTIPDKQIPLANTKPHETLATTVFIAYRELVANQRRQLYRIVDAPARTRRSRLLHSRAIDQPHVPLASKNLAWINNNPPLHDLGTHPA